MNSVAAPRLRITVTVYPKARGLALGLTITAAPQLIAQLTQVMLKNAVDYSSILLPLKRLRAQPVALAPRSSEMLMKHHSRPRHRDLTSSWRLRIAASRYILTRHAQTISSRNLPFCLCRSQRR